MNRIASISFILFLGLFGQSIETLGGTLLLNEGGQTKLEVVARTGGGANQIEDLNPVSLPFDGTHTAIQGGSRSQATYHLDSDGFVINSSGVRDGATDSRANVQPVIFFSVSVDTPYAISGKLTVEDPSVTAKYVEFTATLTDLDTSSVLFHNSQAGRGKPDQSYSLGGTAGTSVNELSGSMTGLLLAGHRYRLYYGSSIYADNRGNVAAYTGEFKLTFKPEQALRVFSEAGQLKLTWPDSANHYVVEASDALGSGSDWQVISSLPGNSVVVPVNSPARFFRLKRQ